MLLCLLRTLLPEAWVLALHNHGHTTELTGSQRPKGKLLLSPRHSHCQTEQFYNVPFQASSRLALPQPRLGLRYQPLAAPAVLACSAVALRSTTLRGPPVS
ncbi:hypothetical protein [Hymenobacter sp. BRD67]|uniref:hypothetical protein n=1 Tax=Hymenobacter sp. BRD67 TaxID=2675877 RepID=UPI00156345AA|nr:hypothetical protein [Hymenobacter sp. BRD67]QKG54201.1 hypothetical protein GKZ67_18365 [Hymenobacter sp. BRD67]